MGFRLIIFIITFLLYGCKSRVYTPDTPEGALRLFISAWAENNPKKAYELLATDSKEELKNKVKLLSKRGITLHPWELLLTPMFNYNITNYKIIIEGEPNSSQVKAIVITPFSKDSFLLKRESNDWRVVLPF